MRWFANICSSLVRFWSATDCCWLGLGVSFQSMESISSLFRIWQCSSKCTRKAFRWEFEDATGTFTICLICVCIPQHDSQASSPSKELCRTLMEKMFEILFHVNRLQISHFSGAQQSGHLTDSYHMALIHLIRQSVDTEEIPKECYSLNE